jgi:branched-chain amino acid transport system permease protein
MIGAVLLVYLKSVVGTITEHHQVLIGALFIIVVIFFPRGLVGYARERWVDIVASRRRT